jgi:hypothetical protein
MMSYQIDNINANRNFLKGSNRNPEVEEHNIWKEKFNNRAHQKIWAGRKKISDCENKLIE